MKNDKSSLDGRVALVTGGTSGIGEAIARRFSSLGARVVVSSRDLDRCKRAASGISQGNGNVLGIACDVRSEGDVVSLFDKTVQEFGKVDIVVASAGISGGSDPVIDYPLEQWKAVIETNLTGVFLTARETFRTMGENGGHLIIISSQAGVEGYSGKGVYCASKFGARGLGHVLNEEGRKLGISVSTLCPGTTDTPILAATKTSVKNPLHLEALADAAEYLATLGGNAMVRDIVLERMEQG
jgi:NAD(P)-dependent dehydrogenase (short-subunit alcohol dehydrogenase family)